MSRNVKATAGTFPYELEASLYTLDRAVSNRSMGYLDAVCEAVGGAYTTGRLRTLLERLRAEAEAKAAKEKIDAMSTQLTTQLLANVSKWVAPPPPPAPVAATPTGADDTAPPTESTTTPTPSPRPAAPPVEYDWAVRWDQTQRALLYELMEAVPKWVALENAYRSKFTQSDKRWRTQEQVYITFFLFIHHVHIHNRYIHSQLYFVVYEYVYILTVSCRCVSWTTK